MKKNTITAILATALLIASNAAHAEFGEKVNCQTTSSQIPIYAGWASCVTGGVFVDQYVFASPSSSQIITEYIDGRYYSCWASVPFSHYDTVTSEQCDYKPVARIWASPSGTATTIVTASGRDFDGSIVENKLWINGQLQSSNSIEGFWSEGTRLTIKARTKDNDGYTHETTKTYYVEFVCDKGEIITC